MNIEYGVKFMAVRVVEHNHQPVEEQESVRNPQDADLYVDYHQSDQTVERLHEISQNDVGITAQNAVEDAMNHLIHVKGFEYIGVDISPDYYSGFFSQVQGTLNDIASQLEGKVSDAYDFEKAQDNLAILQNTLMIQPDQPRVATNLPYYSTPTTSDSLFVNDDDKYVYSQHGYYDEHGNWIQGGWDTKYQEGVNNGTYEQANWQKPIDEKGCSLAVSAMVTSNIKQEEITPDQMKPIYQNDSANDGGRFADEVFEHYDLDYSTNQNFSGHDTAGNLYIDNVLENGGAIIRSVTLFSENSSDPVDWNGHYVALLDVDTSGDEKLYYFADPNEEQPGKWVTEDSPEFQWMAESHGTTIMVAPDGMSIDDALQAPKGEAIMT